MSTLLEKKQDSRGELFQFGSGDAAVREQNQFIGSRKSYRGRSGKAEGQHFGQYILQGKKPANLAVEALQLRKPVDEQADALAGHGWLSP